MKRFMSVLALSFAVSPAMAAAPSKTIALDAFNAIHSSGPVDIHVVYAETAPTATITAEKQDDIDAVTIEVKNNELHVGYKKMSYFFFSFNDTIEPLRLDLVTKPLTSITSTGSGNITLPSNAQAALSVTMSGSGDVSAAGAIDTLTVKNSGSGDATFTDLVSQTIQTDLAGSGDLTLLGQAQNVALVSAGSGDIFAQKLVADNVTVDLKGSGDARVNATASLVATTAGSGDIQYKGTPKQIKQQALGTGSVANAEE